MVQVDYETVFDPAFLLGTVPPILICIYVYSEMKLVKAMHIAIYTKGTLILVSALWGIDPKGAANLKLIQLHLLPCILAVS